MHQTRHGTLEKLPDLRQRKLEAAKRNNFVQHTLYEVIRVVTKSKDADYVVWLSDAGIVNLQIEN